MMMLSELARVVGGELRGLDVEIASVGTDSRKVVLGQLFVALKGEKFDGNLYATQAMSDGAAAVMVSDCKVKVGSSVWVKDTRVALGKLAAYWRHTMPATLVAVTGSNGKTTTKDMLTAILVAATGSIARVHATQGNLNNDIGLPLTLLNINAHHQYVVAEMGMNHLGEIDYLTQIAQPDVAVICNAGTAHIGELGSRENIAKAKGEIFSGLKSSGLAVINADDVFCDYWQSLNAERKIVRFGLNNVADVVATYSERQEGVLVRFRTPEGEFDARLAVRGQHNVYNALAACAAAVGLGINNQAIAEGLTAFAGVSGRLQEKRGLRDALLIDDTYNANPDSMKAAIDVLMNKSEHAVLIMGDMGELGMDAEQMHAEIGRYAKQKGVEVLLALGVLSQYATKAFGNKGLHFEDVDALVQHAQSLMRGGVVLLVKGSRFMQMERVVHALEQNKTKESEGYHAVRVG